MDAADGGPSGIIVTWDEVCNGPNYGTYYEISFNSTTLNAGALVSGHEIHLSIDKSGTIPYYASRTTVTYSTTINRPTQILFPLVQDTSYTKNVTIIFEKSPADFTEGDALEVWRKAQSARGRM